MRTPFTLLAFASLLSASPLVELDERQQPPSNVKYIRPVIAPAGQRLNAAISRDSLDHISNGLPLILQVPSPGNGVKLKVWDCYDVPQQRWHVHDGKIGLAGHNLCMDTTDGLAVHGTVLQIWQCYDGNQNQQFAISGSMQ
ncbi:uncharacterized protein LOC62_04G006632 [Vanrija pseudolonga]|uniref:Ricin B lectin domain-containing protein n=1 Tax=Vanrija pseudolonga TaxID=143232 RepID=A0AAF0YGM2_9TREE|nr:hypothetical protein LOC62_04G006632 [Vanrija pseudolonga]